MKSRKKKKKKKSHSAESWRNFDSKGTRNLTQIKLHQKKFFNERKTFSNREKILACFAKIPRSYEILSRSS